MKINKVVVMINQTKGHAKQTGAAQSRLRLVLLDVALFQLLGDQVLSFVLCLCFVRELFGLGLAQSSNSAKTDGERIAGKGQFPEFFR